jgi:hypothetical protein
MCLEMIKIRDRLKAIQCGINLKPLLLLPRRMVSCENPINLHAPRKSIYRSGMPPCPRRCVFICAYFIRRAYYFVMKIHSPRELILLHLARMTSVFFRHLQIRKRVVLQSLSVVASSSCDTFRIMISVI